jgi:hypothetical protein
VTASARTVDLVAEQLDTHGVVGRAGEDVHDAAAPGVLPLRGDGIDGDVAHLIPARQLGGHVEALCRSIRQREGVEAPGVHQRLQQRARGRHHHGRVAAVAERLERLQALLHQARLGRGTVVGQGV